MGRTGVGGEAAAVRVLIASTPVGALGSGVGGGVELTLHGIALGLVRRGHEVTVLAPEGSVEDVAPIVQVPGTWQTPSQHQERSAPVTLTADSVLVRMWDEVRRRASNIDVVLNMAYDWLPFFLTPFLPTPVGHLVSMASISDAMDEAILSTNRSHPGTIAMHSRAQAATFGGLGEVAIVGSGLDLDRYEFVGSPERRLGWVARIAREKGLDDAFAVAEATGLPLSVWGLMEDEWVWKDAVEAQPHAQVTYEGFLPTDQLQAGLGRCLAALMTPQWVEAFGNVAVEAMACGVPVISYACGGPTETVIDGVTGFLVEPGSVEAMVAAVRRVDAIDRAACRARVESEYSLDALAARVEAWLAAVAARR
jgi:UDP-glucose:tetrahydrobiopterin glucosyltransferase